MNFIDYCIATKNYSTLGAINDYMKITTRTFDNKGGKKGGSSSKGKTAAKIAAGVGVPAAIAAGAYYYPEIRDYIHQKELAKQIAEGGIIKGPADFEKAARHRSSMNDEIAKGKEGAVAEQDLEDSRNEVMGRGNAANNESGNLAAGGAADNNNWELEDRTESRKFSNIYKRYGQYFR